MRRLAVSHWRIKFPLIATKIREILIVFSGGRAGRDINGGLIDAGGRDRPRDPHMGPHAPIGPGTRWADREIAGCTPITYTS